jgi:DNA-binding transcriptional ArsR family regulator
MSTNPTTTRVADRVEHAAGRLRSDPLSYKLLKRLWFTPQHKRAVDDMARQIGLESREVKRGLETLKNAGIVAEEAGESGVATYAIKSLSVHALVSRVLETDGQREQRSGGAGTAR